MLAAAAVVLCAATAIGLGVQLGRTRHALQADGVHEFNFIQQVDHHLDALAHALDDRDHVGAGDARAAEEAERAWRLRLDILHSAVFAAGVDWGGSLLAEPEGRELVDRVRALVERIDAGSARPPAARLRAHALEARALSAEVHAAGVAMYQAKTRLRDAIGERLDRLSRGLWLSAAGFLFAGTALVALLALASARARHVVRDVIETQRQLEAAHDELTDGDLARESQNRFLAQATHDLRQPLQALQYYLAALDAHVEDGRGREILVQIGRSTHAAQRLLAELLDISKLDAGVLEAHRRPTDLGELLARVTAGARGEAEARGLAFEVDDTDAWVDTDGSLLERILANLVANALAYTREGTVRIEVTGGAAAAPGTAADRPADRFVAVAVADTGIGIPSAEREAIFDEYYRLDGPDRDPERGIGIGLAIVRRLARLLDIPVRVDSEVGRGTRFELRVPCAAAAPPGPVAVAAREALPGGAGGGATLAGLAVLVIDDEPEVRASVTALLEQQGCTVLAAAGVGEALDRIVDAGLVPDLVVADYRLGDGVTGVDAIERVREEVNEEVPAIVVTGDTAPERLREAAASGLPLLHKPIDAARLFAAMRANATEAA